MKDPSVIAGNTPSQHTKSTHPPNILSYIRCHHLTDKVYFRDIHTNLLTYLYTSSHSLHQASPLHTLTVCWPTSLNRMRRPNCRRTRLLLKRSARSRHTFSTNTRPLRHSFSTNVLSHPLNTHLFNTRLLTQSLDPSSYVHTGLFSHSSGLRACRRPRIVSSRFCSCQIATRQFGH